MGIDHKLRKLEERDQEVAELRGWIEGLYDLLVRLRRFRERGLRRTKEAGHAVHELIDSLQTLTSELEEWWEEELMQS